MTTAEKAPGAGAVEMEPEEKWVRCPRCGDICQDLEMHWLEECSGP